MQGRYRGGPSNGSYDTTMGGGGGRYDARDRPLPARSRTYGGVSDTEVGYPHDPRGPPPPHDLHGYDERGGGHPMQPPPRGPYGGRGPGRGLNHEGGGMSGRRSDMEPGGDSDIESVVSATSAFSSQSAPHARAKRLG